MINGRKIIFKCRTGSHLYGTNRPTSDEDYSGVFLPSTEDLLSIQKGPEELTENKKNSAGSQNEFGDIDCKFFSIQKFIRLASEGQPGQLEMLFAPKEMIIISTPEWDELKSHISSFLSKRAIVPFIGFCLSQAHRAVIKGENLNTIKALITWGANLSARALVDPLSKNIIISESKEAIFCDNIFSTTTVLKWLINEHGYPQIQIAGRAFDPEIKTKAFLNSLKELETKYGSRVRSASKNIYDYKSLGHAVRLLGQAEELLLTGAIILPRPDAEYLKQIFMGIEIETIDWFDLLNNKINYLKEQVVPISKLPDGPNLKDLNKICINILKKHI